LRNVQVGEVANGRPTRWSLLRDIPAGGRASAAAAMSATARTGPTMSE